MKQGLKGVALAQFLPQGGGEIAHRIERSGALLPEPFEDLGAAIRWFVQLLQESTEITRSLAEQGRPHGGGYRGRGITCQLDLEIQISSFGSQIPGASSAWAFRFGGLGSRRPKVRC